MATIAKILPLPVTVKPGEMTMQNALAERGFMRHPGTGLGFPPLRSPNGKYLTGLDENADYIERMLDPKAKEIERSKIRERRDRLEKASGFISDPNNRELTGLGPRAPYYSKVFESGDGKTVTNNKTGETHSVAPRVKLVDGANLFNFGDPQAEIQYWWVIQNKDIIATSEAEWKAGRCKSTVQFYISNAEEEAAAIYSEKKAANTAIQNLEKMSIEKRKKVAKLIGLPVTDNDKEQIVYNLLDSFIHQGEITTEGENKGQRSVVFFNRVSDLSDDLLDIKTLVKEALNMRVYVKKSQFIYEGEQLVYNNEDEMVKDLSLPSKQMERKALEIKVADKQKMKQGMTLIG